MGGMKHYIAEGGFSQWLYKKVGDTITVNGMTGKVVTKIGDSPNHYSGLPLYSNTSDFYIKISDKKGIPEQIRIFINRRAALDLDWNHEHKPFEKGNLHVHSFIKDKQGKPIRQDGREATEEEIRKYLPLLKAINPNIKIKLK